MACICYSFSFPPILKPPNSKIIGPFPTYLSNPCPSSVPTTFRSFRTGATNSTLSTPVGKEAQQPNEASMSIDNIHSFFDLNLGKWNGSFFQFDAYGNLLHKLSTKLAVSSYGEDELISLIQT